MRASLIDSVLVVISWMVLFVFFRVCIFSLCIYLRARVFGGKCTIFLRRDQILDVKMWDVRRNFPASHENFPASHEKMQASRQDFQASQIIIFVSYCHLSYF